MPKGRLTTSWLMDDAQDDTFDLQTRLEEEGLDDEKKIKDNPELMARREELLKRHNDIQVKQMIRNEFLWQQEREEEKLWQQGAAQRELEEAEERKREEERRRTSVLAQKFLKQVHPTKREAEPEVLDAVRAAPLKIDVAKWEAPKFEKDAKEEELLRNTAKKHFLFRDDSWHDDKPTKSKSSKPIITGITKDTVRKLIDAFEPVKIEKGKTIVEKGSTDNYVYVIEKKTIKKTDDDKKKTDDDKKTTPSSETIIVGAQNLLHSLPAQETIVADESTKVYRLDQETYRGIVQQQTQAEEAKQKKEKPPKVPEEKKSEEPEDDDEEWWKDSKTAQHQLAIRDALEQVKRDDLERVKLLGEGQFGEVWLVAADLRLKASKEERFEFALKMQDTRDEYEDNIATAELNIMKEVTKEGHPFVSMLYRSYETEESKDMLLGLIPGGELWDNIHKEDEATGEWVSGLSEGASRFYVMMIADTLDYLHTNNYIFRDLKPENIMLDGYGYPVIVDFGFCKRLKKQDDKTFTFCGTPNYVAPEIVLNIGHNGKVDCWALGITIFEMISGINPFFWEGVDQVELYRSICEDEGEPLPTESNYSKQVRNLIKGLLAKDPSERLSARDTVKHSWFEGLSLKMLRKRQIKAPWIPKGGEGEKAEYFSDCYANSSKREKELEKRLQKVEETMMSPMDSPIRMSRLSIEELVNQVPDGIVNERLSGTYKGSSPSKLPIVTPTRQNMEKGLVARLAARNNQRAGSGEVPSVFANFPRLDK